MKFTEAEQMSLSWVAGADKPTADDEVAICRMWIRRHVKPSKRVNYNHSIYGLKHVVERWVQQTGAIGRHLHIEESSFTRAAGEEGIRIFAAVDCWRLYANIRVAAKYSPGKL